MSNNLTLMTNDLLLRILRRDQMLDIAAEIRDAFHNVNIQISQKELCNVAKVSPSQVRYWEKKGYIHS